ncbi:MAG TPA: NUDIX domain-containing protein [Trebonia sp.]|nr:NUDIX domain-containing protein [Trebonia sp.]
MADSKPESKLIKAAGAVAWRSGPDGTPEILLVHRRKFDDWSLPKGKIEPGEHLPVTAVREVLEEGGARIALGRRLGSVRYNVGGRPKRVHYWAAAVTSVDDRRVPNDEVDKVEWVGADDAAERISYNRDNALVADFARHPADTVPVILLRHAKAVAKSSWKRADDRRPLDDSGRADAEALADLLACFAPGDGSRPRPRLITSPAARCVATLRPFAELSGAELREEPSLYIHNQSSRTVPADSHPSIETLLAEAIAAGEPTIFCAHRENIPVLQAAALAALGLDLPPSDAAPGSALAASALTGSALASSALASSAHGHSPLADSPEPAIPDLPKEWDDPLPTSGFWVLNLTHPHPTPASTPPARPTSGPTAPAPAPTASAPSSTAPAPAPTPAPAASAPPPLPAWRRWFRTRARTRTAEPAPSTVTSTLSAPGTVTTPPTPLAAPVLVPEETAVTPVTTVTPDTTVPARRQTPRLISADRYDLTELLNTTSTKPPPDGATHPGPAHHAAPSAATPSPPTTRATNRTPEGGRVRALGPTGLHLVDPWPPGLQHHPVPA